MDNIVRSEIELSELKQGMTVEYRGEILTVSKDDVKHGGFHGSSFRGDASKKKITRIEFAVPTAFGIVLR
jgi:hypothetical protein